MNELHGLLEICRWNEQGYAPLVFCDGWQTALLNWEPIFDFANAGEIERHKQTDEVFVLWRGQALLFVSDGEKLRAEIMRPGIVYNVPRGVWHNLLSTRDASWIIVENRDTHLHDTELRSMTATEWETLEAVLPEWVDR